MKRSKKENGTDPQSRQTRGQVKEAAGDLLHDDQLERQGQEEQKAAKVKRVIGQWVTGAKASRPADQPPRRHP